MSKSLKLLAKWLILVISYLYLAHKLYDASSSFSMFRVADFSFAWLLAVVLLLPLNIALETKKWQSLCASFSSLSFRVALKQVLRAFLPGFITPNRVGEMAARTYYFEEGHRSEALAASLLNGIIQTMVIASIGFFAFLRCSWIENPYVSTDKIASHVYVCVGLVMLMPVVFYFLLKLAYQCTTGVWKERFERMLQIPLKNILFATMWGVLRYGVFALQLCLMLRFFHVVVPFEALIYAVGSYYFLVTLFPSVAFTEVAVRGSFAMVCFGVWGNEINIFAAVFLLWVINFASPMLVGTVFFLQKHKKNDL